MVFCAACGVKNCAKKLGEEGEYPGNCPSLEPEIEGYLAEYSNPEDYMLAHKSAICSPDHSESRVEKTIHFAKECGFKKIGLAFCITLKNEAQKLNKLLKQEGFEVASVICKVGHVDRTLIGIDNYKTAMCNPIAQAEILNKEGTDLNIIVGLCVGHDTLFIRHSKAPVTVLIAKDHVYNNRPSEYLEKFG